MAKHFHSENVRIAENADGAGKLCKRMPQIPPQLFIARRVNKNAFQLTAGISDSCFKTGVTQVNPKIMRMTDVTAGCAVYLKQMLCRENSRLIIVHGNGIAPDSVNSFSDNNRWQYKAIEKHGEVQNLRQKEHPLHTDCQHGIKHPRKLGIFIHAYRLIACL